MITEKIRAEFIGRGKYAVTPEALGADAVLTGEITNVSVQPVGFTEQQLASRYLFTLVDARAVRRRADQRGAVEQRRADLPRGIRAGHAWQHALDGAAFLDQERSSVDRIAGDLARSVVTAILEAF